MTKPSLSIKNTTSASRALRRERTVSRALFFALLSFFLSFLGFFAIAMGGLSAIIFLSPVLQGELLLWLLAAILAISLSLLLLAPFWEGILSFCSVALWEEKADYFALFSFLVDKKLFRFALLRGSGRVLRLILWSLFSLFVAYFGFGAAMTAKAPYGALLLALTVLFLVFLLLFFLHLGKDKLLFNALLTKKRTEAAGELGLPSYLSLCYESANRMRRYSARVLGLFLRYLPLFILSALFLGAPLLFFLPRYLLARAALITAILNE